MNQEAPLSFHQIQALVQDLKPRLFSSRIKECLSSSSRRFTLVFEKNKQTFLLFFCLEPPFVRFHLIDSLSRHQKEVFSLESTLKNSFLESLDYLNEDRILQFQFQKDTKRFFLVIELFTKHPNYYLLSEDRSIIKSLFPSKDTTYQLPVKRQHIEAPSGILLTHSQLATLYEEKEALLKKQQDKQMLLSQLHKKSRHALQGKEKLSTYLLEAEQWSRTQHQADLIKSSLGQLGQSSPPWFVYDWDIEQEIELQAEPQKTPKEWMSHLYKKAKKLKESIFHSKTQLEKINHLLDSLQQQITLIEQTDDSLVIDGLLKKELARHTPVNKESKQSKQPLPFHEFTSVSGLKIWVGKSARDNEELTFKLAKGSDWWFHAHQYPGSHVILRVPKGKEPDPEAINDAIQLALHFSKAKSHGEGEVCISQRKHITKFSRGQPGKVQVSTHRLTWTKIDAMRYERLKERTNKA